MGAALGRPSRRRISENIGILFFYDSQTAAISTGSTLSGDGASFRFRRSKFRVAVAGRRGVVSLRRLSPSTTRPLDPEALPLRSEMVEALSNGFDMLSSRFDFASVGSGAAISPTETYSLLGFLLSSLLFPLRLSCSLRFFRRSSLRRLRSSFSCSRRFVRNRRRRRCSALDQSGSETHLGKKRKIQEQTKSKKQKNTSPNHQAFVVHNRRASSSSKPIAFNTI